MGKGRSVSKEVRINCRGRRHRILIMDNGRMCLPDHDLEHERTAEQLGVPKAKCLTILDTWRKACTDRAILSELPQELRPLAREKAQIRKNRGRSNYYHDPLKDSLRLRFDSQLLKLVSLCLTKCSYRRPFNRWNVGGDYYVGVRSAAQPFFFGRSYQEHGFIGRGRLITGTSATLEIRLPPSWVTKVYNRGIAAVDGIFIVDVLREKDENTLEVLAGRQGRGYTAYLNSAIIRKVDVEWTFVRFRNTQADRDKSWYGQTDVAKSYGHIHT